ncbi:MULTISPECIES: hypothetical protein [Halopseudomonas]|uniref:Uncharacterized protein n=1 Tax=Halopseudomonas formosensis TaxID=1002526 RepID=A0ABU5BZS2_9GAMM|nr:hypothetical protein [Halopseudomonas formosensis]MDX9688283.1 hypothetical protein [Halopseudomonas formosensis]
MKTALHNSLAPWAVWLCAGLLLSGCSTQQPASPAANRVEHNLVSHTLSIDAGEPRVLSRPQRIIRVTEHKLHEVIELDAEGRQLSSRESYQTVPWANQTLTLIAEGQEFALQTDHEGAVRLNLLEEQFVDLDLNQLRAIELVARTNGNVVAEADLLVSRELRSLLQQAVPLIYDSLEEGDVAQWVSRVRQLEALGLSEESTQLENMLILLTIGDPELQFEFVEALDRQQAQDHNGQP